MRQVSRIGILIVVFTVTALIIVRAQDNYVHAQAITTPNRPIMTVVYDDAINVRQGPHSVYYPVIGRLFPGEQRFVLGRTPAGEWVLIEDGNLPGGKGWVYASVNYISISTGDIPIVEPPPTPTPIIPTIDPTLAAAFNIEPTPTRLATFTPASPFAYPTFLSAETPTQRGVPVGAFILVLALLGISGFLLSRAGRK
jgi:hypothetical protein